MNQQEQFALLIRLDERTESIEKKIDDLVNHAENGGWGRCREREFRISELEGKKKEGFDRAKWFNRLLVGSVMALIVEKIITYI